MDISDCISLSCLCTGCGRVRSRFEIFWWSYGESIIPSGSILTSIPRASEHFGPHGFYFKFHDLDAVGWHPYEGPVIYLPRLL